MPEAFATPVSRRQTIATLGAGVAGLALAAPARAFAPATSGAAAWPGEAQRRSRRPGSTSISRRSEAAALM